MDSLEKGCFELKVFAQLSSWIYTEMKKIGNAVVYTEVDYIEMTMGCYYDVRCYKNYLKLYKVNAKI